MMVDIKKTRIDLGLSQEGLARRLGVSLQTIHRWETGKTKPSPMAIKLLEGLKM